MFRQFSTLKRKKDYGDFVMYTVNLVLVLAFIPCMLIVGDVSHDSDVVATSRIK